MWSAGALLFLFASAAAFRSDLDGETGADPAHDNLNPKESIICEVCETVLANRDFDCEAYEPSPALFNPDVTLPEGATRKNLINALGAITPPDRQLWTSDGRVRMSDDAVKKVLGHLRVKESDSFRWKRATDILRAPAGGKLATARRFCGFALNRITKKGPTCVAKWSILDKQHVRRHHSKSLNPSAAADYCSCVMHAESSRYGNTPWDERRTCAQKEWSA
eukprot:CAMPEP_0179103452 /NCGR_PEP_ID=MMETSP0796-20121207/47937_1 /TAXON_ID=73915 /ORGANISM="Pyrodinium bahamense, Strain pbaha01" /LENGTH=220 /DNA_ID=CAMNT_0020801363 /DNA_START=77 /DNA_END=739 /DNA_ORIENTATION=-